MKELIGDKIKNLREKKGLSQEALAYNICTQSEISRIENSKNQPSLEFMTKIAERLGVKISYFLEENIADYNYFIEVKNQLSEARRNRDYQQIYEIVETELRNPLFQGNENEKYLLWHKGISLYHLFNNKESSIKVLVSLLPKNSQLHICSELEIEILNSIGIIHRNEKEIKSAISYLEKAFIVTELEQYKKSKQLI